MKEDEIKLSIENLNRAAPEKSSKSLYLLIERFNNRRDNLIEFYDPEL